MSTAVRSALRAIVGHAHVLTDTDTESYCIDERRLFSGRALAVVRPANVAEVSAVVRCCAAHGVAMVPHGGNTGYCGGATPDASGTQVVISLARLNRILAIDPAGYTLTVEAGTVLANAQAAAAAHDRLLPLSMGSQGSCQIGGNLATNAGGLAVLRYGNARDLALGLQAVLPDGSIYDKLSTLRKDNTGYDLKQLFIGAEGTLGIITAATLKLYPRGQHLTAWVSLASAAAAIELLGRLRAATGDAVTSFEYMTAAALGLVAAATPGRAVPVAGAHHVLVECLEPSAGDGDGPLAEALAAALADGLVGDVVIAQSDEQRAALWRLREGIPAAEKQLGGSVKHDVSVPLSRLADYVERATQAVASRWPDARLSVYGHVGDGNVHFNVLAPPHAEAEAFKRAHGAAISDLLHDLAHAMHGSFSAEHGVGQLKRDLLRKYADPVTQALLRSVKQALDPRGLMNPGKLVP